MGTYITELDVSLNPDQEQQLLAKDFMKVDVNLNKGTGGNTIYLWYRKGNSAPITRIQLSFKREMEGGLINAGYVKIDKSLNTGAGEHLFLWYSNHKGEYHTPIDGISVTGNSRNEARKFGHGWERVACDLNRHAGGEWIHIWVRRAVQTYICDVGVTDTFVDDTDYLQDGFIRMDVGTNRTCQGSFVYIWYRQTTDPSRAITGLEVAVGEHQLQSLRAQGYKAVAVNLSEAVAGTQVYLLYKRVPGKSPIKGMTLLANQGAKDDYVKSGLTVIDKDILQAWGVMFLVYNN